MSCCAAKIAIRAAALLGLLSLVCAKDVSVPLQGGGSTQVGVANSTADALLTGRAPAAKALALAGGGFRAFSTDVGLLAGLLAVRGRLSGESSLEHSGLLQGFGTLSSNSGGSWFAAELVYSPSFLAMVEAMAASPNSAGHVFQRDWMAKFLAGGKRASRGMRRFTRFARSLGLDGLSQSLEGLDHLWHDGLSWSEFTAALLRTTSGLGPDVLLGSPPAAWARGKTWLVAHSLASGGWGQRAFMSAGIGHHISYMADWADRVPGRAAPPAYIPARFSIQLGAGIDSSAPLSYVAAEDSAKEVTVMYEGAAFMGLWHKQAAARLGDFGPLATSMGRLPVTDVVAASSAVFGGVCFNKYLSTAASALHSEFIPWAAVGRGAESKGTAFQEGAALAKQNGLRALRGGLLDKLASSTVVGTIDGGYTDGTGIAHAVSAGATEVTALLSMGEDVKTWTWLNLFQESQAGQPSKSIGIPMVRFPIFEETAASAQEQFSGFRSLALPQSRRLLSKLQVGTIQLTTAKSEWFGISAGHTVTLNIVAVTSSMDIGGLDDFREYSIFVQEIVDSLLSKKNEDVVKENLLAMF